MRTLQIKRGLRATKPRLKDGEFGLCRDTEELFLGNLDRDLQIPVLDSQGKLLKNQIPSLDYIPLTQKGQPNGVVPLNDKGKIDSQYLSITKTKTGFYYYICPENAPEIVKSNCDYCGQDISTFLYNCSQKGEKDVTVFLYPGEYTYNYNDGDIKAAIYSLDFYEKTAGTYVATLSAKASINFNANYSISKKTFFGVDLILSSDKAQTLYNVSIVNCGIIFEEIPSGAGHTISLDQLNSFENNFVKSCGQGQPYITFLGPRILKNCVFSSEFSDIAQSYGLNIDFKAFSGSQFQKNVGFSNCSFYGGTNGICLIGSKNSLVLSNCFFCGNSIEGLTMAGDTWENAVIVGNSFSNTKSLLIRGNDEGLKTVEGNGCLQRPSSGELTHIHCLGLNKDF